MVDAGTDRRPEAVDAGRVDDVALISLQQQRQEGADAEIDTAPADVEGALPLFARVGEQAAAAANAGIVEQQMDLVGRLLLDQVVAKTLEMRLYRAVGKVGGDALSLLHFFGLADFFGFAHSLRGDVAHRDIAAFGDELTRQFAAHARAASGDDGKFSGEILHGGTDPSCQSLGKFLMARPVPGRPRPAYCQL